MVERKIKPDVGDPIRIGRHVYRKGLEREKGYDRSAILKKYAKNDLAGREAYFEGAPKVLVERPSQWGTDFSINLLFTPESEARIRDIADRIDRIGSKLGIEFLLAGRDYPIHSALQSGWFDGPPSERSETYDRIYDDAYMRASTLNMLTLSYKYLLTNESAITLNAVEIPPEIKGFRDETVAKAQSESIRPQNMENILHVSLARFTRVPEDVEERKQVMQKLTQELIKLRHEISSSPIQADVGRVFFGHVMDVARER